MFKLVEVVSVTVVNDMLLLLPLFSPPFLTPHMFQSLVLHVVDNDFVYRTMKNSYNASPQAHYVTIVASDRSRFRDIGSTERWSSHSDD